MARLEERVNALEEKVDAMNHKLDDLLALKYKGAGAFWLMTTLFGTGLFGLLYAFFGGNK